jgi:L-iditol 2-dehydrogenase
MKSKTIVFPSKLQAEIVERDIMPLQKDEILAKTIVNGICMWEIHCFNHVDNPSLQPGHEGISVVVDVGENVSNIKPGDYVTSLEWSEYTVQKATNVIKLESTPQDAGLYMLEPLACAINAVAHTNLYPSDKVLLSGCGYMGFLLLKLISGYPLSNITVCDFKEENLELAKQFGANSVINANDIAKVSALSSDSFQVTYECSGAASSLELCNRLTARGGTVGLYAWHHGTRTVDTDGWHDKGLRILNLSPGITANERRFRSFQASSSLTCSGKFSQEGLITHRYKIDDAQRALEESTVRGTGFIKSIFEF